MRRHLCALVAAALALFVPLAGCAKEEKTYQDGVYSAEFLDFDSYGYKDFMRITVQDGLVTELLYNGLDEAGSLKTDDVKYRDNMESVQETYPAKYTTDLINQYLEVQEIDKVDTVSGATYSSDCFRALYRALEESMVAGNTDLVIVANVPVK